MLFALFLYYHGYLVCTSALKQKNFKITNYYLNRLKKIYLPLVIVTFFTVIIAKFIPSINWVNLKQETTSVIFGYNNFWQIGAKLDYFTRLNNSPFIHFWYISILMQFDLVFPIFFITFKKINKKIKKFSIITVLIITIISTCIFIFMSITQDINLVYYNTFARFFSIMFGILLALIHYKYGIKIPNKLKNNDKIIFILYIIVFIILTIFTSSETSIYAIIMIFVTLITSRLIDYSTIKKENRKETNKVIKLLAKISYEVYLLQYPVIFLINSTALPEILKVILILIITLILSCILHFLLYFKFKNKKVYIIKNILICIIIVIGSSIVIIEKDNTAEIKELQEKLSINEKIIEEKNQEYINSFNIEQEHENEIVVAVEEDKNKEANKIQENKLDESKIEEIVRNLPIVGIGDSVLLGVSDELYERFPNGYFDGKVSRNLTAGMEILEEMINNRKIRKYSTFSFSK